jgi:PAS domain S-box-containing protein
MRWAGSRAAQLAYRGVTTCGDINLVLLGIVLSRRMLKAIFKTRYVYEAFTLAVIGSNDGLWDWNVLTNEMYFSPRTKELVGYADHEIQNTPGAFHALLHPDDRGGTIAAIRVHLRHDRPYDLEFRCLAKTGEYRWLRARGRSVRNGRGRAVRMAGSVTDVTDRKLADAQLFAEKERAQVTLESIGDAVITTDVDGLIEYLNPLAETLTGWRTGEAHGQSLQVVCRTLDETTRKPLPNPVEVVLRERVSIKVPANVLLLGRDGTEIANNETAAPIRDRADANERVMLVLPIERRANHATQCRTRRATTRSPA